MSFLRENCTQYAVTDKNDLAGFSCGDKDLDEFFTNDCFDFTKQLLGKTYCYRLNKDPHKVVCAFTLANAGVRVSDLPNSRKKKIEAAIPHVKTLKDYPAVLVARLGVSQEFRSLHIGSDILDFIKIWFLEPYNKTGCRFVIVDAYNEPATMAFYEQNGFKTVFSTEQQEKDYRHLEAEITLNTRLMFYDLMTIAKDNILSKYRDS